SSVMRPKNYELTLFQARLFCAVALGIGSSLTQAADPTFSDANWTGLGSGLGGVPDPYVAALAVSGSDVYAGGFFLTAGGGAGNRIVKWDGSSWTELGSGMIGGVAYPGV